MIPGTLYFKSHVHLCKGDPECTGGTPDPLAVFQKELAILEKIRESL